MLQSRIVELTIRLLAAFSEVMIAYMTYLFINYFLLFNMSGIGLMTMILVSLCSIFIHSTLRSKTASGGRWRFINEAVGITISICIVAISGLNGISTASSLVLLILVWLRGEHHVSVDSREIYSMSKFRYGMLALLTMNLLSYTLISIKGFSAIISQCSVLYAVLGIYILTKCKELQFCHIEFKKSNRRTDIAASTGMLAIIILLSSRKVMEQSIKWLYNAASFIFDILYQPMFYIGYAVYKAILMLDDLMKRPEIPSVQKEIKSADIEEYMYYVQKPWLELLLKAIVFLTIAVAVIMIFVFIRRRFEKTTNKNAELDYTEDREFLIGTDSVRSGITKVLDSVVRGIGPLGSFKQSNSEKIRSEYRRLLGLLYRKSLIGSGATAEGVGNILSSMYPETQQYIQDMTITYERVRYGGFEPDDEVVGKFKNGIAHIKSNITV